MAIGVDYTLFWHLNPTKLKPFFEAERIRNKGKMQDIEIAGYVNGLYVCKAVSACFSKSAKYPSKPIGIFDLDNKEDRPPTEEEIKQGRENLLAKLQLMQASFEANKIVERGR